MTPKLVQFCDDPPKIVILPNSIHFSDNPKNIEIRNVKPPKNGPSLRMYDIIRAPTLPWDA